MITTKKTPFEQAVSYLGSLKINFTQLPRSITDTVCEIRLRAGQQAVLECGRRRISLDGDAVTPEQIGECVREFCGYSIHSYEKQFKEGWLTLKGGHRAGFTGTAVLSGNAATSGEIGGCGVKVENVRDISSVNLRIAKQYTGCGEDLFARVTASQESAGSGGFTGLLIIGKPMSAKTTVLRDLCRLISAENKVALIDERSEVAAVYGGVPALDVGRNTDVLNNFPKGQGIMTALRSLSPEYVVCDEIGWEVNELAAVANSGVKTILTAHSGSLREAYAAGRIQQLLNAGGVSHIALLGHGENIGKVEFYGTNKNYNGGDGDCSRGSGGVLFFPPIENAGRIT